MFSLRCGIQYKYKQYYEKQFTKGEFTYERGRTNEVKKVNVQVKEANAFPI
jgi:hypothetical protein